ncbi:MAG: uL22 family ribosomal protein [Patescibacteria group bacterium]
MANPRKTFRKFKKSQPKTQVKARGRYLKVAPTKVRDLLDLIRGKDLVNAQAILRFSGRKGGQAALKVLKSAIANAKNPSDLENWFVTEARADKGPIFKRSLETKPRGARGLKTTSSSHIEIGIGIFEKKENAKKN